MRVGVTGASGLIGSALSRHLRDSGHHVTTFVRGEPRTHDQIRWRPGERLDQTALGGLDAIVHLAGAGLGDSRWTPAYKHTIRASRVDGTRSIAEAMAAATDGPAVLVCGSAIGYYGDTGPRETDESGAPGSGFLASVVRDWEAAATPAAEAGRRVVFARTGLVVSSRGGAWHRLFPLFRAGLGGKLSSGRQYWSPISLNDEVRALTWLLSHDVSGPVNLVGPDPCTNAEVTEVMGEVLRRPTVLPIPAFALRVVLGEFAGETLVSQRITPGVLCSAGFTWEQPDVRSMIEWARRS